MQSLSIAPTRRLGRLHPPIGAATDRDGFGPTHARAQTLGGSGVRPASVDSFQGSKTGFSLVEILCAVLVLGVALTGMVEGVTNALSSSKESEWQTVAALFAAGQIETLRAEGGLADGTTDGDCGDDLPLYRWQQTLRPAGIDGLHEVTVSIENSKTGKTIYELKTLLFEAPEDTTANRENSQKPPGSQRRRDRSK